MGYIKHNAIVVTGHDLAALHEKVKAIVSQGWGISDCDTCLVSPIVGSKTNGFESFFVAPDGSKEGWDTSDIGDDLRDEVVGYLGGKCDWVEVQFGDDELVTRIVRDSDEALRHD